MNKSTKRKWSYSLVELLAIPILIGIGWVVFLPIYEWYYQETKFPYSLWKPNSNAQAILIFLITIVVVLVVGFVCGRFGKGTRFRIVIISLVLPLLWICSFPLGKFIYEVTKPRFSPNFLSAVSNLKAFLGAQNYYRKVDYDKDGVFEFAQKARGNFSLLEINDGRMDIGLVDPAFGYAMAQPEWISPKTGYVYKILKAQGPAAPGGKMSYLTQGKDGELNLTEGCAAIAWPEEYDVTGRFTLIIGPKGIVYGRDLGKDTAKFVVQITEFNPTEEWKELFAEEN